MPTNEEVYPKTRTWGLAALAALGLAVIQWGAFAIVSPFIAHSVDDWYYLMIIRDIVDPPNFFYQLANRQFGTHNIALAQMILPDRYQGMAYAHIIAGFLVSLCIFHLGRRLLPRYAWFAFLIAAVYLVYIPFNYNWVSGWLSPYSWAFLLMMAAFVCFIEHLYQRGWRAWLLMGLALVLGYMASRAYENSIIFLGLLPFITYYLMRRITRYEAAVSLLWWVVIGVGASQFIIPYVRGDQVASYQTRVREAGFDLGEFWESWVIFHKNAFPLGSIRDTSFDHYLLPGVLLGVAACLICWLFWQRFPEDSALPPPRALLVIGVIGFALVTIGGAGYIYAGWAEKGRGQSFAAAGQAVVIAAVFGLVAWGLHRLLRLPQRAALLAMVFVFFMTAAQWYYAAQATMTQASLPFDVKAPFFRELLAIAPDVADDTLFLMEGCLTSPYPPFYGVVYSSLTEAGYLYEYTRGSGVLMGNLEEQTFERDGLHFTGIYLGVPTRERYYRYDQLVLLRCEGEHLALLEHFPSGYAPPGATVTDYNPYARLKRVFIPEWRARLVELR